MCYTDIASLCYFYAVLCFLEPEPPFSTMTAEQFADCLGKIMGKINPDFDPLFANAIMKESIRPHIFIDMDKDECENVFSKYLGQIRYGFGISKEIKQFQKTVKVALADTPAVIDSTEVKLRGLDQLPSFPYKKGIVTPNIGNLLVPVHEFTVPHLLNAYTIAKEVVRFTAACMNARRNGTIHIGIEDIGHGCGKVTGIPSGLTSPCTLDESITHYVRCSFGLEADKALQCIRPIQKIIVQDTQCVVLEIDVIASSFCCPPKFFAVDFPPRGPSEKRYFAYDLAPRCRIDELDRNRVTEIEKLYWPQFKLREQVELEQCRDDGKTESYQYKLATSLKNHGVKYVTDEYVPLIVSGRISGCQNESELRSQLGMQHVFLSAKFVVDMDVSSQLRSEMEGDKMVFNVKTADDMSRLDSGMLDLYSGPLWLYANGFVDKKENAMVIPEWNSKKYPGVNKALRLARDNIPPGRAKVVFFIYQKIEKCDPLYELARDMMLNSFPDECVILSDKSENVQTLMEEMLRMTRDDSIGEYFHTELSWSCIAEVLCSVFRHNPDVVCRLPASGGHVVDMSTKERTTLNFKDIEILSGEECKEAENMTVDEIRKRAAEVEQTFYRGTGVSWWNFYFENQVGRRDDYDFHTSEIQKKLDSNDAKDFNELYHIEHHPGAGGSTLGRHLLWHFSQFREVPEHAFRCCVVNKITDNTVEEIVRFRCFKDPKDPKPFFVLVDNKSEDELKILRAELYKAAYKNGTPGKLFCLVILVTRVSITSEEPLKQKSKLLKHNLSGHELNWFEKKYEEINKMGNVDVQTLIAFNVMRHSFAKEYIDGLTSEMMKGITAKELKVLKCLALISSYESDNLVPKTIFDEILKDQVDVKELTKFPFGIQHSFKEKKAMPARKGHNWNLSLSNAMSLFIAERSESDLYQSGLRIISQPLAKSILEHIMNKEELTREDVVDYVLDILKEHVEKRDPMSKKFVKNVCSLFKSRKIEESDKPETKSKFSDLVLDLQRSGDPQSVLMPMRRCFKEANDAMVGQQLARYYIHINEYDEAEDSIKQSLEIMKDNSYLLDTYGQIFKSKMEHLIETWTGNTKDKISLEQAASVIKLAFKAIDKFKESQETARKNKTNEEINMSCFHMEVRTAISLLENFKHFDSVDDRVELCHFLTKQDFAIHESNFRLLLALCPEMEHMRLDTEWQRHLDSSLRILEETKYQIRDLYTVYTHEETLLLKMRERYERFYGGPNVVGKYKFKYGIGLKPLMIAGEKDPKMLEVRVKEASVNLQNILHLRFADIRDLLVILGKSIIDLSGQSDQHTCDEEGYLQLLRYSQQLLEKQRKPSEMRKYLESYLYFAMLHWPLEERVALNLDALCPGSTLETVIKEWDETYEDNHFIRSSQQSKLKKPKNFFALGRGSPGNDIVDLEAITKEWQDKKKEVGRHRRPVFGDDFWKEGFVEERLARLQGVVDGEGRKIIHTVPFDNFDTFKPYYYYHTVQIQK